ncbi:hypothetical protein G9G63_09605 [Paenibacillus sp. EKM202P]|uniref:hypothetical protein n=1 Tax=unclassified Paenibacillus TaxID=185978 RepID=UPI0013EA39E1|nr:MULTISPECIES: hypothetical protein [unclassified Paenibacillus]KAF6565403.1 hypothetical protein G9G63_09605 [Paenibacillus sp. EKM202P]KAF6569272.1 hypothetical protein G9G64_12490 [Paenibacillus sp. EKM207P]
MDKIIDDTKELVLLSPEKLDDKLLEEKYNKANLRELVRRSLKEVKEYKSAFEHQLKVNEAQAKQLKTIRSMIDDFDK